MQDEYVEMEAYEDYHIQRPFIDNLFIKIITDPATALAALEAHEIDGITRFTDIIVDNIERLEADPTIKLETFPANRWYYLEYNMLHPQLHSKWVRRAMVHALDRESYIEEYFKGYTTPVPSSYTPASYFFNPNIEPYEYDVELAKEYMEMAGFKYEYLEEKTITEIPDIPTEVYYTSGAIGFVIGCIIAAIGTWLYAQKKLT